MTLPASWRLTVVRLEAVEQLEETLQELDLVLIESGGDNLTATFSRGLVDAQVFVIDVASGDNIPRTGGPGITTAYLLIVNKTDLAPCVGADLGTMASGAQRRRGDLPVVFTSLTQPDGIRPVADWVNARLACLADRDSRMTRTTASAPLSGPARQTPHPVHRAAPAEHDDARHNSPQCAVAGASEESAVHPSGVHATARIRAEHNGRTTTLPLLHSDGPFHLRRLRCRNGRARVSVLGAMSAPLGGDRLALGITAGTRARLDVATSAVTIALRGSTTDPATYDVRLTAGEDASLN
ncbi:hypothetical protein GCM10020367_72680 [Streptomyces sannanensis]|uniref:CobW/HypB/UreG nucleotide-binding domain-containing protein n=1 Tax=Streptomyces sannanensis TaxID=285536 RepID=A0ABP6SPA7_9ACTN